MNLEKLKSISFFDNQNLEYAFDGLTRVLNREIISSYLKHLIDTKSTFTLCLCDVDNFKSVNDNYGHMMGDEVLQRFAASVEDSVGNKGLVGRYGGDEFMIILDGISEYNDIWEICHRINKRLADLTFPRTQELSISATTGISRFPLDGNNYDELLETADKALYRGKMKGRNCFIIYLAAKHKNILVQTNKEKVFSSMEAITNLYQLYINSKSQKSAIINVLNMLSTSLFIDHICLEDYEDICIEHTHSLMKNYSFKHIPIELYEKEMNNSGIFYSNSRRFLQNSGSLELFNELKNQNIISCFNVKIMYDNKCYGILRAESLNSKIWQSEEMDLLVIFANMLAYSLKTNNITLKELINKRSL